MNELYLVVVKAQIIDGVPQIEVKVNKEKLKNVTALNYLIDGKRIPMNELNIPIRVGEETIDQAKHIIYKVWCNDETKIEESKRIALAALRETIVEYKNNLDTFLSKLDTL